MVDTTPGVSVCPPLLLLLSRTLSAAGFLTLLLAQMSASAPLRPLALVLHYTRGIGKVFCRGRGRGTRRACRAGNICVIQVM
jgi:hypothetical protein